MGLQVGSDGLVNVAAKAAEAAAVATAAAPSSSTATRVPKDLPAGYWQAQIQKCEAVTMAGEPGQFPQCVMIGAEAIIGCLAHEVKLKTYTAVSLHKVEHNPRCSAQTKAKGSRLSYEGLVLKSSYSSTPWG